MSNEEWTHSLEELINSNFSKDVERKKEEFLSFKNKSGQEIFFELCFCFLTANTSADLGIRMQESMGMDPFISFSLSELTKRLKNERYRFYNTRSKYIVESRWIIDELPVILNHPNSWYKREFLVESLKGIGYKEASHFLRNTGSFHYAILDKHIIRMMDPEFSRSGKALDRKKYYHYENKFLEIASKFKLEPGILDLYMWKLATNKLIK